MNKPQKKPAPTAPPARQDVRPAGKDFAPPQRAAPPVYRPCPTPVVLQTKRALHTKPHSATSGAAQKTMAAQSQSPFHARPTLAVLQAKPREMLRTAPTPQADTRRPVAPPVYRPQPPLAVLQAKPRELLGTTPTPQADTRRPIAPPVYRPQPTPRVLQRKAAPTLRPPALSNQPSPVAPRVCCLLAAAGILQPKSGRNGLAVRTHTHHQLQGSRFDRPEAHAPMPTRPQAGSWRPGGSVIMRMEVPSNRDRIEAVIDHLLDQNPPYPVAQGLDDYIASLKEHNAYTSENPNLEDDEELEYRAAIIFSRVQASIQQNQWASKKQEQGLKTRQEAEGFKQKAVEQQQQKSLELKQEKEVKKKSMSSVDAYKSMEKEKKQSNSKKEEKKPTQPETPSEVGVSKPTVLYRWVSTDEAKRAKKEGIAFDPVGGGIPTSTKPSKGVAVTSGAVIMDKLLIIDTSKIPGFTFEWVTTRSKLKEVKIKCDVPASAIQ